MAAALIVGLLGLGLGAGLAYGFHAALRPAVQIALTAAVGIVAAALVRQPPHRHETAFETVWRSLLGGSLGAALGAAAVHWLGAAAQPVRLAPLAADTRWLEHPMVLGVASGLVLGMIFGVAPAVPASPTAGSSPPVAGGAGRVSEPRSSVPKAA